MTDLDPAITPEQRATMRQWVGEYVRAERAARDAACWAPPPGQLWRPKDRLPRWQASLYIASLSVALWGTIGLCVTVVIGLLVVVMP